MTEDQVVLPDEVWRELRDEDSGELLGYVSEKFWDAILKEAAEERAMLATTPYPPVSRPILARPGSEIGKTWDSLVEDLKRIDDAVIEALEREES